jgi:FkbM family methyltransferase
MISCFLDGFHRPVKNLPEDPVIFDLGVNVGYTLVDFKHLFPNSKIVGVEMDKQNAELANKNISGLDGIEIHHAAIFHKDDVIYYDSDDEPDAFHAQSETSGKPSLVRVDAITLDTLMTKSNLTHIDYMKMDIEGAEQEIFSKGNLEWLERVDQISIEIHSGVDREMIETALKESGMNVENHPTHWSSIIGWRI